MVFSISNSKCVKALLGTLIFCLLGVGQGFAAWDGSMSRPSQDSKGVFIITNEAELAWFADTTNWKTPENIRDEKVQLFDINARLESDLDMSGGNYFTPICGGNGDKKFKGTFDGQNHVISNLKIDGDWLREQYDDENYGQNVGFIGAMSGGTVHNLILENINIHSSTNITGTERQISVGAIVGWMENGTIDNCVTSGSIFTSGKGQGVGGIAGALWKGTISNCLSYVGIQVSGQDAQIGGIVGLTKKGNTVTIKSCVYAGTTLVNTGNGAVAGIVGQQKEKGTLNIEDCYYDTDVVAKGVDYIKDSTKVTDHSHGVSDVNDGKSMCEANDGNWGVCSVANHNDETSCLQNDGVWYADSCSKEGAWSTGENSVSLNGYGADGYKITFDANGGSFPANAKKTKFLAAGVQITADEITTPNHAGAWAFAGWALTNAANAVPATDFGVVSGPKTIYAVWKPVYTITFNVNPGVFPAVEGMVESATRTKTVAQGDRITVEGIGDLPTRYCSDQGDNGCNVYLYFTGWAHESVVLGEEDDPDDYTLDLKTINVEGPVELKAVWTAVETYTVTFDANKHGKTKVSYVKVGKGERATPPLNPEADAGYHFDGWCLNEAPCVTTFDFDNMYITQSINLVAAWSLDAFNINYETFGGANPEENKTMYTIETETFSFKSPTKDGFDFENWYYNYEDGVYSNKATQITKGTTGDKTLYAKWNKKKYIITYLAGNDAHGTVDPDTLNHDSTITLKNAGDFVRKGYQQTAWVTEKAAQTFDFGAEYSINASITLYPTWKIIDYKITYVLNAEDATNHKDNKKTYRVNQSVTLKEAARTGYVFAGWFENENLSGDAVTMIKSGSTGDKTFYAKWVPISYTITYELNGGTNAEGNPESYTIEDLPIDLLDPVKTGYEFDGWYYNSDFSGDQVSGIYTLGSDVDVTLYAKWEKVYPFLVNDFGAIKVYEDENGKLTAEIDGMSTGDVNTISPEDNVLVNYINFNREFPVNESDKGTMYSTIVLPFTIEKSKVPSADFYELKAVDVPNATVEFWTTKETLQANTPYIIRTYASTLSFNLDGDESVALNTSELNNPKSDDGKWEFRGTYSYIKWIDRADELGRAYGFRAQAENSNAIGSFARIGTSATARPFRAYLLKVANQQARRYTLAKSSVALNTASIGEETIPSSLDVVIVDRETEQTTVIGKLNTATGEIKIIDNWFDMKGRKLNGKPTTKGIYYYNGKRVMVK